MAAGLDGKLALWRAGRIAEQTICLPEAGAAHVDRYLAPVAHSCSWAQLDRMVEEALVRFDPAAAEAKRRAAAEKRHVDVQLDQVSFDGTVRIDAEVDLADALDLEDALRAGAKQQADLGSTESLDVRRSIALGDLARRQLAFGFDTEAPARPLELHVHFSDDAVGRCANTRSPISVDQIREWCGNPDATITVKPVIDLNEHVHVEAYEAPDRLKEQNAWSTSIACSRTAPNQQPGATPTTSSPTPTADRRAQPTPRRCVDGTTAPRPTRRGTTPSWTAAPTCGPPPTASS